MIILVLFAAVAPARAAYEEDGHTDHGFWARLVKVESRGFLNFVGIPFEFVRTIIVEADKHPRLWPVTVFGRWPLNIGYRIASITNDIFFLPWILPYTDDISPLTEPMGISEYPWQID